MILETTNPYCFTYKTEELLIELLGAIRIDGQREKSSPPAAQLLSDPWDILRL